MKRNEVTEKVLKDMGWSPIKFSFEEIIFNLQNLDSWKYLRCRVDRSKLYEEKEYGMCSTYLIKYRHEYFEVSNDNENWKSVMVRNLEIDRHCVYAD